MSAFEDSNDAPFLSSLYTIRWRLARYARDHTVSMHGCADVFRRYEKVRPGFFFRGEETVASWIDRQFARYQVSFGRQDVSVFPNPRYLPFALELPQRAAQCNACLVAHANFPSNLDRV